MEMDDAAAVTRVRAGEKECFRVLVERHSHEVFRLAFRMMGNEQDAEEVVQDTFLRAYRSLDRFQSRSSFGTWLYRIAANRCYDLLDQRKSRPEPQPEIAPDEPPLEERIPSHTAGPERKLLSQEIGVRVQAGIDRLTPSERTAFVLRHFEGRSIEEIARVLEIGLGATKNSIHRAVQKLRQELEPLRATR
jgi:RNA polymerase sigma-70 factor, ECF subfamily